MPVAEMMKMTRMIGDPSCQALIPVFILSVTLLGVIP